MNKRDKALMEAVIKNDAPQVRDLLSHRTYLRGIDKTPANPNACDNMGFSCLHFAKSAAMVDMLCHHQADPIFASQFNQSLKQPLHTANNYHVTRALLRHGADVTATYKPLLNTALHIANSPQQVDVLVEAIHALNDPSTDWINLPNRQRQTPLDCALSGIENPAVAERIRQHGGKTMAQLDQEHAARVAAKKAEMQNAQTQESARLR